MPDFQGDRDFGNALIELGIVSLDRVREGLRRQRVAVEKGQESPSLEQILIEIAAITPEQAARARAHLAKRKPVSASPMPSGFEVIRKLGSGGMGAVYLARQVSMDRQIALKILSPRLAGDPAFIARFQKEARTAAKLNHPNIITVFDVGESEGAHYLIMEYVEGPTARQLLDERGRLDEKQVADIGLQVVKALEAAHRVGVVHRDIKPENIMLTRDGVVKLCDLGLAQESGTAAGLTGELRAVGTPRYMAPEQAKGDPNLDVRTDLYALGATLYHLVTGEVPFDGETREQIMAKHVAEPLRPPRERCPEISERLSRIVVKLMHKDRADRYQTPGEVAAALQPLVGARPTPAGRLRAVSPARRFPAARRSGLPAAVVGLILVAALVYVLRDRISRPPVSDPTPASAPDPAGRELEDVLALQRADSNFDGMKDVLLRYGAFAERYPGTVWEGRALEERRKYIEQANVFAKADLDAIRQKEAASRSAEQWREVLRLYGEFPAKFLDTTPSGVEVKEEMARIRARASEKLSADRARLAQLMKERRLDEALSLAAQMEGYALESALPDLTRIRAELLKKRDEAAGAAAREAADQYLAVEARVREYLSRRDYRLGIAALSAFLCAPWTDAQRPHVLVPELDTAALKSTLEEAENALAQQSDVARACTLWEAAAQTCETFAGDPSSPAEVSTAQRTLLDLRNAIALELLRQQTLAGLDRVIRGRERMAFETYENARGTVEVREGRITFVPEGGAARVLDPGRDLREADLVALAARSLDPDPAVAAERGRASPKFLARAGLLYYYAGSGPACAGRAEEAFAEAAERGALGVRVYLADLREVMRRQEDERLAARYEEAMAFVRGRRWAQAQPILEELLRSKSDWVEGRRGEISGTLSEAAGALREERELALKYRGVVERLSDGRLRVRYDFEDKAQADAFEVMPLASRGRWFVEEGRLESSKLASAVRWVHPVKGDVEVEYRLMAIEDPPQNIVASLYYNPGKDRHYWIVLAFDLVFGSADPKDTLEDRMGFPRACVLKYPIAFHRARAQERAEWDKLRERLVGTARGEAELESSKGYRVHVERVAKAIRVRLDGKLVWEGEDEEYGEGFVLFYSDSRVWIDDLAVTVRP
ncbi:MAG: protein kinase [Planctomycetes bacterium]|nr:protein kinase [Planctomycetota bacterium]